MVCLLISISLAFAIPNLRSSLMTDELAQGSRKIISLIKSSRAQAVSKNEAFLIYYDAAEDRLWYQPANTKEKEDTPIAHSSITLPPGIRIQGIKQLTTSNKDLGQNGIWISKQGYMDKTAIQLADRDNTILSLLISPFIPTIKVIEGPVDFK